MEESFNWIKGIISSSWCEFHLIACKKLIELFKNKYQKEPLFTDAYEELISDLIDQATFLSVEV